MPMPKTSVYEDGDSVSWQNEIRLSRKIAGLDAKAKAGAMQVPADGKFRPGVFRPDFAHQGGSLMGRYCIHSRAIIFTGGQMFKPALRR
jgi:hypothetical protein